MFIKMVTLSNYKGFVSAEVRFHKMCTILIGDNGSGKSSILDGIATGIAAYLTEFNNVAGPSIKADDSHLKTIMLGDVYDFQKQFPIDITIQATFNEKSVQWSRSLNGPRNKTTIASAEEIRNIAKLLQIEVSKGNKETILPLVAYYGTGRVHKTKSLVKGKTTRTLSDRTLGYADSLETASSSKAMYDWLIEMDRIEYEEKSVIQHYHAVLNVIKISLESALGKGNIINVSYSTKVKDLVIEYIDGDSNIIKLPLRNFSDGIKGTTYLVAEIAYRMAILNPNLGNKITTKTSGVVLIDEIEMHLHPKWQSTIIKSLMEIFPMIQFIISTHSPSVLSNLDNSIDLIRVDKHEIEYAKTKTFGASLDFLVKTEMKTDIQPDNIRDNLSLFFDLVDDNCFSEAEKILQSLKEIMNGKDPQLITAEEYLSLSRYSEEPNDYD